MKMCKIGTFCRHARKHASSSLIRTRLEPSLHLGIIVVSSMNRRPHALGNTRNCGKMYYTVHGTSRLLLQNIQTPGTCKCRARSCSSISSCRMYIHRQNRTCRYMYLCRDGWEWRCAVISTMLMNRNTNTENKQQHPTHEGQHALTAAECSSDAPSTSSSSLFPSPSPQGCVSQPQSCDVGSS